VSYSVSNNNGTVRCYPHVVIGYGSRKEFTINPSQDATSGSYTMVDFTNFLAERPADQAQRRRSPKSTKIRLFSSILFRRSNFVGQPTKIAIFDGFRLFSTVSGR
jgi:hypothetical protein